MRYRGEHAPGTGPAGHALVRLLRNDRRWHEVSTRALAAGVGTAARPPSRWRNRAWRQHRAELRSEAGARYLTIPPTAESGGFRLVRFTAIGKTSGRSPGD